MPTSAKRAKKPEKTAKENITDKELNIFIEQFREELAEKTKQCLSQHCKPLLESHSNVDALRWKLFTPTSCDFEPFDRPGTYRADTIEFKDKHRNEWVPMWGSPLTDERLQDDLVKFENFLHDLPLALAFGEYKKVLVNNSGVTVTDFDTEDF